MRTIVAVLVVVAGCIVGDGGGPGPGTGSSSGQDTIDAGAAVACTGAAYDPCTTPDQCMSTACQLFQQSGFQVCTQSCTPGDNATCPSQNGVQATCNNMGICKPAAANACAR